jgi:hypothetical protein
MYSVVVRLSDMKKAIILRLTYEQSMEFWKLYQCVDKEKRIRKFINDME